MCMTPRLPFIFTVTFQLLLVMDERHPRINRHFSLMLQKLTSPSYITAASLGRFIRPLPPVSADSLSNSSLHRLMPLINTAPAGEAELINESAAK